MNWREEVDQSLKKLKEAKASSLVCERVDMENHVRGCLGRFGMNFRRTKGKPGEYEVTKKGKAIMTGVDLQYVSALGLRIPDHPLWSGLRGCDECRQLRAVEGG